MLWDTGCYTMCYNIVSKIGRITVLNRTALVRFQANSKKSLMYLLQKDSAVVGSIEQFKDNSLEDTQEISMR